MNDLDNEYNQKKMRYEKSLQQEKRKETDY